MIVLLYSVKVKAVSGQDQVQVSTECLTLNFIVMGTIKQGILGGFSGKVGTVAGSSWKGISYMRGRAQNVKTLALRDKWNSVANLLLRSDF